MSHAYGVHPSSLFGGRNGGEARRSRVVDVIRQPYVRPSSRRKAATATARNSALKRASAAICRAGGEWSAPTTCSASRTRWYGGSIGDTTRTARGRNSYGIHSPYANDIGR